MVASMIPIVTARTCQTMNRTARQWSRTMTAELTPNKLLWSAARGSLSLQKRGPGSVSSYPATTAGCDFSVDRMTSPIYADLIPGMFFTPLESSSIRWMSCCLFILLFVPDTHFTSFAHFFQTLFLFFGCVSSLLDESSDFLIFL